ncbi:hypothetical protein UPYG_G00141720 [Umbra pygmaea]|uniref:Acyl-CoA-binding domain-containing protein 5 n=1 Tax=Umbra pygmaea TaxID=75934 RepID=A0ABD0WVG5_UMBPY
MPQSCHRQTFAMPVPVQAMAESVDHQKRFQAAVDVIHNLPKNGSYRPSYEVMLRFYSLYKQAVCGPCTVSRPGFWDPVGRYKWDAWNRLGDMNSESAMEAYVEEMKKVAQEFSKGKETAFLECSGQTPTTGCSGCKADIKKMNVIDTMPMNEKTASLFHHFEPLYVVIDDMPRPPATLLNQRAEVKCTDKASSEVEDAPRRGTQENPVPVSVPNKEPIPEEEHALELVPPSREEPHVEALPFLEEVPGQTRLQPATSTSEPQGLTSDSESEIFVDSVDSVELLENIKIIEVPKSKSNGLHNGHAHWGPSSAPDAHLDTALEVTQVGAGKGGEGAGDGGGPPGRRSREAGRDGMRDHRRRERGAPQGSPRRAGREALVPGEGAGRGGGDGSEGGAQRQQDVHVHQEILLALRRLREDMQSVMERLEAVECITTAQRSDWRTCIQCAASTSQSEEETWWPFPDVSGRTMLVLLLWPLVAQGLVSLLRRGQKKLRLST